MGSSFGEARLELGSRESEFPTSDLRLPTWCYTAVAISLALALTGCEDGINKIYGQRGGLGADSVNGTAVLANMFQQAGHRVSTTSRLTPRLKERAEVIVWAPDDFSPPKPAVIQWFDEWWLDSPDRLLIYIGRDYDAAPKYWRRVQVGAPAEQLPEIKRRLAKDQSDYLAERGAGAGSADCEWFSIKRRGKRRKVASLTGDPKWLAGINAKQLDIELRGKCTPAADAQVVLASSGDSIVTRQRKHAGELILVVNGSFLLNLPLVNHEHRKLASKLIAEAGADRRVLFLESGAGGPSVLDEDPPDVPRNGMEIFGVKPFSVILLHLAFLGMIFCAARFPIFGRPRELAPPPLSDFGRHVWALGQLLQRTQDRAYALGRLLYYQQHVRREPERQRPAAPPPETPPRASTNSPGPPAPPEPS
ncbi:MAG TPA: hypothetical protein VMV10_00075 [Pirellulales bacterium]|nr:hypothetical protein [Pirellulales bacterium]